MNHALFSAIVAASVVHASVAIACSSDGKEGFAPENNLYIPESNFAAAASGISKADFDEVNKKTQAAYAPVLKAQGRTFKVFADWADGTVNAKAMPNGKVAEVYMFGGLARHPLMTKDGFQLVICHETGHHLGGAPRNQVFNTWGSDEGQSDYYATFSCARKMWAKDNNVAIVAKMEVPAVVVERCKKSFSKANDAALCMRSTMAGKNLGDTLGDLNSTGDTDLNKTDTSVVRSTNDDHPDAQCRLDTYFAAALCAKAPKDVLSARSAFAEACASEVRDVVGVRPRCWYKPGAAAKKKSDRRSGTDWPLGMR